MITFSEFVIWTVTCTCRAGVDVDDLDALFLRVALAAAGAPGVVFCRSPQGELRGDAPPRRAPKRAFGRQITFGVRVAAQKRLIHLKLFGNGTIQTTGALAADAAYDAARHVCAAAGFAQAPIDLAVRMINGGIRASCRLNLLACFDAARAAGALVSFDPCCYSALKVSLFYGKGGGHACACAAHCVTKKPRNRLCRMVTVSVFESGSVGISGAVTSAQVHAAVDLMSCVISGCRGAAQLSEAEILAWLRRLAPVA